MSYKLERALYGGSSWQRSKLWIGTRSCRGTIDVLRYDGKEYYNGMDIRLKLKNMGFFRTTPPFIANNVPEALEIAYCRLVSAEETLYIK